MDGCLIVTIYSQVSVVFAYQACFPFILEIATNFSRQSNLILLVKIAQQKQTWRGAHDKDQAGERTISQPSLARMFSEQSYESSQANWFPGFLLELEETLCCEIVGEQCKLGPLGEGLPENKLTREGKQNDEIEKVYPQPFSSDVLVARSAPGTPSYMSPKIPLFILTTQFDLVFCYLSSTLYQMMSQMIRGNLTRNHQCYLKNFCT